MTDRIDHAAEARKHIDWMEELLGAGEGSPDAVLLATGHLAQAHATLALVEQQRLANLTALSTITALGGDMMPVELAAWGELTYGPGDFIRPGIAAALGIETGAGDE